MKSFSQFLNESYLSEEDVQGKLFTSKDKPQDFRNPKKIPFTGTDPIKQGQRSPLPDAPKASPTSPGQLEIPEPKTTKVTGSQFRNAGEVRQPSLLTKSGEAQDFTKAGKGKVPFTSSEPVQTRSKVQATPPNKPSGGFGGQSPGQMTIPGTNVGRPGDAARNEAEIAQRKATERASAPKPAAPKLPEVPKPEAPKVPGKFAKIGKFLGPASAALDTALSTADERSKGSGWGRSLAKGATVAAGGLLGGTAGAIGGGGILSAATGTAGALAGGAAAEKAFDTVAGANAKERKAMATTNRQKQAGTAIKGIGGKTTFDTKKNTMTTGTGSQRKTVALAKTGVVQRGGKSTTGHLAYKDGKAVYKAGPSAQSLAKTSSNPLERVGRSLFAGAYKKSDAANAAKKLATARQSDAARNKALGVKAKPAG
jgi:hypothetical protein